MSRKKLRKKDWTDFPPREICTDTEGGYIQYGYSNVAVDENGKAVEGSGVHKGIGYENVRGLIDEVIITKTKEKAEEFEKDGYKIIFTPERHKLNQYVLVKEKSTKEVINRWKYFKSWKRRHKKEYSLFLEKEKKFQMLEMAKILYQDTIDMRNGDKEAKELVAIETMVLNALTNATKVSEKINQDDDEYYE